MLLYTTKNIYSRKLCNFSCRKSGWHGCLPCAFMLFLSVNFIKERINFFSKKSYQNLHILFCQRITVELKRLWCFQTFFFATKTLSALLDLARTLNRQNKCAPFVIHSLPTNETFPFRKGFRNMCTPMVDGDLE